jgi:hypothetical protein
MAGDFPVRLLQVRGAGSFTGYGYITIPFLGYNRLKVKFDNIQVNTDRQLMAGVIMSTFDSLETQVVNIDTVARAFSDFASVINDLAHLAIDADYLAVKELTEEIRKMAEEELPDELKQRMDQAADNLVQAKQEYDEAKKAYDAAQTPEEKADAKKKMDAAEQKFEDAKKEVEAVNKEKEALVKKTTDIILQAIKKLGKDAGQNINNAQQQYVQQGDQLDKSAISLTSRSDSSRLSEIMIIADDEEDLDMTQEANSQLKAFADAHKALVMARKDYATLQFALVLYKQFTSSERLELIGKLLQSNGKTLIVNINQQLAEGKTTDQAIEYAQTQILNFITRLIVSE